LLNQTVILTLTRHLGAPNSALVWLAHIYKHISMAVKVYIIQIKQDNLHKTNTHMGNI